MKFVKPNPSPHDLPQDVLSLGPTLELIHNSKWVSAPTGGQKGAWSQGLTPLETLRMILDDSAPTVLQSTSEDFSEDVKGWVKLREAPLNYFSQPLSTLLPSGRDFETLKLTGVHEKEQTRASILEFAQKRGNAACVEAIQAIFEELFMNAMLDAPREATQGAGLSGASFHLGCDDRRMGIACHDSYGSLNLEKLLKRMRKVYEDGAGPAINMHGPGGAGLGCMIMLEKSSLICFGVDPGQATVVSCLVHRHLSRRRHLELDKSLHLVTQG